MRIQIQATHFWLERFVLGLVMGLLSLSQVLAQTTVSGYVTVSDSDVALGDGDLFGSSVAFLEDLDGDGDVEVAIGARGADGCGAVRILSLDSVGAIMDQVTIGSDSGGFDGTLDDGDRFGEGVTAVGDIDGNGTIDLAVGTPFDDDGGSNRGAVWILFLGTDGSVTASQKISSTNGEFDGELDDDDWFGYAVGSVGDLNDDDVPDLLVGSPRDDDGGEDPGAVWVLLLNDDGTVSDYHKISEEEGDFEGTVDDGVRFGCAVASVGDLDSDGISDLVVGARHDDDGGDSRGAIWVVFLDEDLSVREHQKISGLSGVSALSDGDQFGSAVAAAGDLNSDDVPDLIVGAAASSDSGAVWFVLLESTGEVFEAWNLEPPSAEGVNGYGYSAAVYDVNGDDEDDLLVGAPATDGTEEISGAVVLHFLGYPFVRGDASGNGSLSALSDSVYLLLYAFTNGAAPPCFDAADADDDGVVSPLVDSLFLLNHFFHDAPPPPDPASDECDADPTNDAISCSQETCA